MLSPPTVTASDTGLSRPPPQASHGTSRMNWLYWSWADSVSASR
jgi:hypothetical protein